MLLSELIKLSGGLDISDNTFDWGAYIEFTDEPNEEIDWYNEFCKEIAQRTEVVHINQDWYSPCKVSEMIVANMDAFKKFFNEENREGYRPMDYENADDSTSDDGFYEAYLQGLESLLVGNYAEEDYEKLVKLLRK